ncbi:MAG: hypothetical protein QOC68_2718 [Solirubrobacteraceae bacterium]|nr:hypothetical protein [Solirubrobacteraceae bacterium]
MRRVWTLLVVLTVLMTGASTALAHPERQSFFPDASKGAVPIYRHATPPLVVCKRNSKALVRKIFKGRDRARTKRIRLRTLKKCRFRHIQAAVNAAKSNDRIQIMPGVYKEEPSRKVSINQPECASMFETPADGDAKVPTFEAQSKCPNMRNLIAIIGDSLADPDRECDQKCNLLIEGLGRNPRDVRIEGDRLKKDVIRADRADGFFLRNVAVEQGAFNDVDVVETNGFRLRKLVTPYAQNYGVLTFASDHGLYDHIDAYGNGDSGIYPGSGPEGHCKRYGIEIRNVNSHDNVLGYSGTAGNGTWTHNSWFHDNNAGISDDSFASGHPGMPQDCSKWNANQVYSNNRNFFTNDRDAYCKNTPFEKRPREIVCPQFQVPVGSGFILYGVNSNIIQDNKIYDNWRSGVRLFYVPASIRGDNDPAHQFDTSNGNQFIGNQMSLGADNKRAPNGIDFFWDEQGIGNCWRGNQAPGGRITSDPANLPQCPHGSMFQQGNLAKLGAEAPCAAWDPDTQPDPPGCTWFTTPPKPKR